MFIEDISDRLGTALVDTVGPALLIDWSEIDSWMLRQIHAVCPPTAPGQPEPKPDTQPPALQASLLVRARELDAEHRAAIGRPISRDTLRGLQRPYHAALDPTPAPEFSQILPVTVRTPNYEPELE